MKTSVILTLDKRRKTQDHQYPIKIRLSHFSKSTSIATGHKVPINSWDENRRRIKSSYKGTSKLGQLNNLLAKIIVEYQDILNELHDSGELDYLSIKQVKAKLTGQTTYDSFYQFGDAKVEELRALGRYGTAKNYEHLLNVLRTFTRGAEVKFNEVNYQFLKDFERYHLSKKGNSINGIASYMRTLRAIYNKGIKEGLIKREAYPFTIIRSKRFLLQNELLN